MWRRAMFLLLFVNRSNTKVHLSADACSLDWPGGTPGNYWWGCAALFSKSSPYFRPKNVIFSEFPRGLCIKTRLSAQPLIWKWFFILMQIKLVFTRKVVLSVSLWKWGFLELESGLLKRWIHSYTPTSSLENCTIFQTQMGKFHSLFQTKTAPKPYPLGRHTHLWLI